MKSPASLGIPMTMETPKVLIPNHQFDENWWLLKPPSKWLTVKPFLKSSKSSPWLWNHMKPQRLGIPPLGPWLEKPPDLPIKPTSNRRQHQAEKLAWSKKRNRMVSKLKWPVNPNLLVISICNWDIYIYRDIFSVGVQGYNPNDHFYHLKNLIKNIPMAGTPSEKKYRPSRWGVSC